MSREKGFSAIEVLIVVAVLAILAGGVWVRSRKQAPPSLPVAPTSILTPTSVTIPTSISTTTPHPTLTPEQSFIQVTIPSDWQTYDEFFGFPESGANFSFRYPPQSEIYDLDPSSGSIYIYTGSSSAVFDSIEVSMDTYLNFYGWAISEYENGSRRIWHKQMLERVYPEYDFSGLTYKEMSFDNGKRYLKVAYPKDFDQGADNATTYFGIQGGVSFFVNDAGLLNKQDFLRILSSLSVSR